MANWCNARLVVVGRKAAVKAFSDAARLRPTAIFREDMLAGEAAELRAERVQRSGKDRYRKVFVFQVSNDDGLRHFRQVSRRHRRLSFILVFGDPNLDDYSSYLLKQGSARSYRLPQRQKQAVMLKHGVSDDDEDEWRFWEASWEAMDIAEARWAAVVERPNHALRSTSRAKRSATSKRGSRATRLSANALDR